MRCVSEESFRENQNTHFVSSNSFPRIVPLVVKYGTVRQAASYNTGVLISL